GGGERRKPHDPIELQMVRGDLDRAARRIAGLRLELVLLPRGARREVGLVGALDDDLVTVAGDVTEEAVGIDEMERIEARVHYLATRRHVADHLMTQGGEQCSHRG